MRKNQAGLSTQPYRVLKPLVRAYALGYLSSTGPRIVDILAAAIRKRHAPSSAAQQIWQTLHQATALNRFPAFCAVLVGGSTLLPVPLRILIVALLRILRSRRTHGNSIAIDRVARFLASLIAATLSFSLLNSGTQGRPAPTTTPSAAEPFILSNPLLLQDDGPPRTTTTPATPPLPSQALASAPVAPASTVPLAGKTIDLTLFALVRALDTLLSLHASTRPVNPPTRLPRLTVPLLFAASSATIMHAYFYASSRLPRSYQSWLTRFAQVDARLLLALRHARTGRFRYGADTGLAPLLGSLCAELGLPEAWGDPATTIPVPCRLVHQGVRGGCEANALARGGRAWALAMRRIYLPLQALALLRRLLRRARAGPGAARARLAPLVARGLRDAARGAAFLAAFVALFWYGVCLARTRAGPRLFGRRMVTPQMWDGGLCVAAGCALCGWSVLVEERRRRAELLLFVLPRAAAVWGPRAYDRKYRWREQLAFALSTAVIFTTVQERPARVRGVFGSALGSVLRQA